jgi:hypothetical protein
LRNKEGHLINVSFNDLVLAQVDPIQDSPWTKKQIMKID